MCSLSLSGSGRKNFESDLSENCKAKMYIVFKSFSFLGNIDMNQLKKENS